MLIMRSRLIPIGKNVLTMYSIFYTVLTLVSCVMQLMAGKEEDTNMHLIHRAVVTLIGVLVMEAYNHVKIKNPVLTWLVIYVPSMLLIFLYVWITGFFEPLSSRAYRDIFLNYTSIAVIAGIIILVIDLLKMKRIKGEYENK